MLLFGLNLQAASAPAPAPAPTPPSVVSSPHGFEMVGYKTPLQRIWERRQAQRVQPATREAKKKARVIEVKAAKAVMADAGEPQLKALMRKWLETKPVLPPKADPYQAFLGQVARRLQRHDDEEAALLLLM